MDKVLCLIETNYIDTRLDEQEIWMDLDPLIQWKRTKKLKVLTITPLIDHLHSDKENGQPFPHYHWDSRYSVGNHKAGNHIRVFPHLLRTNQSLEYMMLNRISDKVQGITPVNMISNSKLKHNCIHRNKCPHRGYDLSNEIPDEDGIITCPLHGLKFNTNNQNKLLNNVTTN